MAKRQRNSFSTSCFISAVGQSGAKIWLGRFWKHHIFLRSFHCSVCSQLVRIRPQRQSSSVGGYAQAHKKICKNIPTLYLSQIYLLYTFQYSSTQNRDIHQNKEQTALFQHDLAFLEIVSIKISLSLYTVHRIFNKLINSLVMMRFWKVRVTM